MVDSDRGEKAFLFFEVEGLAADTFRVVSFSGTESISRLFRFDLEVVSPDRDLDYQSVLGRSGHLVIKADQGDRHVHGVIRRVEETGRAEEFTNFRLVLMPRIWGLGLGQNYRIFQDQTVPDIVRKVLKDAGVPDKDVKQTIHGTQDPRAYCVQFHESNLNFVSRLLEQEGIAYWFEHSESETVMRMGNNTADHPPAPGVETLPLRPGAGMVATEEAVSHFGLAEEVRPDAFATRDYNFETPSVDLTGEFAEGPGLDTEVYEYPGEYLNPTQGRKLSELRLQALRAARVEGSGASSCCRLTPGHTFEIEGHPRSDWNGKYLLVDVQHTGSQPQALGEYGFGGAASYSNSFTCIPASTPFRPARATPRPSAQGAQTAVVVGPSGEEVHTDEYGRIKVQFHWDREGTKNENSSCWIRVAQSWAGKGWGALYLPRIGQEVIVEFLDSDPDQPIITGSVYNAENMPPYDLPANKTKSTLMSNSSKGGGGSNELRFEDMKNSEEIYLHAQKDWNVVVENDESDAITANRTVSVGKDEQVSIGGNRTESVAKDESISIEGNRTESVAKDETISIDGNRNENVAKDESISIGKNRALSVGKDENKDVGANARLSVGKKLQESVGEDAALQVGKNQVIDVGKKFTLQAGDQVTIKVGSAEITMKKNGDIQLKGKNISIKGSGNIVIKGSKITEN